MASGQKTLVISTQERAVSTDISRLQAFAGAGIAEVFRYFMDVTGNDDLDAGSVVTEFSSIGTPLRAEIINGLLVKPQVGSLNLLVDAGVLFAIAPDTDPDASNYKLVKDPGVSLLGALVMTANPAGTPRIDVIEVQVTNVVTETDSRDIYNPATGLFAATSVTKARQSTVTFVGAAANIRVRAGVAGAGYPAAVSGWLPICVASLPAGTVSNDTITFWDVRPLVSDRAYSPFALTNDRPIQGRSIVNATTLATTTGIVAATLNGRRIGGRLRSGSVVADADNINVATAANQEPGIVFTASRPWYLYFLTPFGLPRWARYTAAGARLPRSPRGIPVVSMTAPDADGRPSVAIALPTLTGLGASTTIGMALLAGYNTAAAAQAGFYGDSDNGFVLFSTGPGADPLRVAGVDNTGAGVGVTTFSLTAGTHYPTNARALLCEFQVDITSDASSSHVHYDVQVRTYAPNGGGIVSEVFSSLPKRPSSAAAGFNMELNMWVPLPTVYPATAAPTQVIDVTSNDSGAVLTAPGFLRVLGWKL